MKNKFKNAAVVALVMVIGFSMAALSLTGCDNSTSSGGGDPTSVPYKSVGDDGKTYDLVITQAGKAAYTPTNGDRYTLKIDGAVNSTGTITKTDNGFTLKPDGGGSDITITISGSGMTSITLGSDTPITLTPVPSDGSADPALNGTWVSTDGLSYTANNGSFEIKLSGSSLEKGIYTTSNGNISVTCTHVWGGRYGDGQGSYLEMKWYSKKELKEALLPLLPKPYAQDEAGLNVYLNSLFATQTAAYSVRGNTLTMTLQGVSYTFTKQ